MYIYSSSYEQFMQATLCNGRYYAHKGNLIMGQKQHTATHRSIDITFVIIHTGIAGMSHHNDHCT